MTYQLMRSRRSSGLKRSVVIVIVLLWNLGKPGSFTWAGMCALEPCCYATGLLALLNARKTYFDHVLDSDQGRQASMSLPMTTFSTASGPAGLSNTLPHKAVQITGQVELQDRDIYNLKSNFPFSL
ncbi:hypothetical protein BD779DRAFT_1543333 [Infundibulicybe gibba]|nr:hypothetical protein BD779DRAFT_1543333 [Infundibulicybe gibba]